MLWVPPAPPPQPLGGRKELPEQSWRRAQDSRAPFPSTVGILLSPLNEARLFFPNVASQLCLYFTLYSQMCSAFTGDTRTFQMIKSTCNCTGLICRRMTPFGKLQAPQSEPGVGAQSPCLLSCVQQPTRRAGPTGDYGCDSVLCRLRGKRHDNRKDDYSVVSLRGSGSGLITSVQTRSTHGEV